MVLQHIICFFYDPKECPLTKYIVDKIKTVEGRKYSSAYQKIKVGDTIIFHDKKGDIVCKVTYINKYKSVREYLETEGIDCSKICNYC